MSSQNTSVMKAECYVYQCWLAWPHKLSKSTSDTRWAQKLFDIEKLIKVKAGIYPYVMTSRRGWIKMVSNMQSVVSCNFASDMTDELEISEDVWAFVKPSTEPSPKQT